MQHLVRTRAIPYYSFDPSLIVDKRRVVGYRAECSCGWRSKVTGSVRAARYDWRTHVAETHPAIIAGGTP